MTIAGPDTPMPDAPVIVRIEDLRAARLCFQGARPWFARHGFDWQDFLADGIFSDRLAATCDALALRVIAKAQERTFRDAKMNPNAEDPNDGR